MPFMTARCHVSQRFVTRITDLEGTVTRVICRDYDDATGSCRVKAAAQQGGPLSRLFDAIAEDTLADRTIRCTLAA